MLSVALKGSEKRDCGRAVPGVTPRAAGAAVRAAGAAERAAGAAGRAPGDVMAHSAASVEQWLDANPDVLSELFLRKADLTLINRWMTQHGLQSLPDSSPVTGRHATQSLPDSSPVTGRHATLSSDSSAPSSPIDTRFGDSGFFDSRHNRSNSKKYLRQDFARSKMKNMFRTYEPVAGGSLEQRRSSLKEMRQFRSLPPTSVNMLSVLIQSKVRLPRYPSKDIDHKRELRYTNEREFFLEIVKDISNDLDLKSLTGKMVVNMSCLADAERASLFLVEGKHSGRPSLVSKIFDVHAGTNVLPSTSGDSRIPWGQGILGHVAETGEVVNLRSVKEVSELCGVETGCLCRVVRFFCPLFHFFFYFPLFVLGILSSACLFHPFVFFRQHVSVFVFPVVILFGLSTERFTSQFLP